MMLMEFGGVWQFAKSGAKIKSAQNRDIIKCFSSICPQDKTPKPYNWTFCLNVVP